MKLRQRRSQEKRRTEDAYERLASAEYASTIKAAYAVTGNLEIAREVTQDAFADLFVHWNKVSRYDKPGAWLRRVAIRKAIKVTQRDAKRQALHARAQLSQALADDGPEILPLLDELSPNQRAAVYLRYYDDLPVAEIASILGCKPATASVHLTRARNRLSELLPQPTTIQTSATSHNSKDEVASSAC